MTAAGLTSLADRREEILDYIGRILRRRGPDSTIQIEVLATIVGAKIGAKRKDILRFLIRELAVEDRIRLRILSKKGVLESPKHIDLLIRIKKQPVEDAEFVIEWITVRELKEMAAAARAERLRERVQERAAQQAALDVDRSAKEAELAEVRARSKEWYAQRERERDTARETRDRVRKEAQEAKENMRARATQERLAKKEARRAELQLLKQRRAERTRLRIKSSALVKPIVVKPKELIKPTVVQAVKAKPQVTAKAVSKPKPQPTLAQCVERAVRALKGVQEINDANVAARAALYCRLDKEKILAHVTKLSKDERTVLGFSETLAKPTAGVKLRPISPSITAKGL